MSLIGKEVSDFTAKIFVNNEFKDVSKADLKGKWSIFFFYPADFTFVCPTELEDLQNNYEEFKKLGCEIYSVSCDTHFVHKARHDHSEKIGKITYPMIADPTQAIARDFEVLIEADGLAERGIRIAFENVDSDELLTAVMETFDEPHVGFCYDSGHECWLTPDAHYIRRYGDRLLCLHLNDNDKTWDKHFLPGDGKADFDGILSDLRTVGFQGPVTLEVAYRGTYPERYTPQEYVGRCYEIAESMAERLALPE